MDKYEFNLRIDQIKKKIASEDFETAMKIADTIDWRRVRNINILSMVSGVYEKNGEYQEAKDILLLAFERAPMGKRLLYKLAELAIKEGSPDEAEDYYREFCELAPEDPRQYILRYLILGAKGAPVEQLIHTLEQYCNVELDEKWLYELAELYNAAHMEQLCVMTCDKIMLMFGTGKYVDKAIDLKVQYAPLTDYQMDLVENKDKYEARLKAVETEYNKKKPMVLPIDEEDAQAEQEAEDAYVYQQEAAYTKEPEPEEEVLEEQPETVFDDEEAAGEEEAFFEAEPEPEEEPELSCEEEESEADSEPEVSSEPETASGSSKEDETLRAQLHEAEAQEDLAKEMSRLAEEHGYSEETQAAQTQVLADIRHLKKGPMYSGSNHLMIEADEPEKGFELAVKTLKRIHQETGAKNQAAKITGARLNNRGIFTLSDKLTGKDLIIEQAGDMNESILQELNQLMARDETGMSVVLIDTAERLEELHKTYPGLAKRFECIGTSVKEQEKEAEPDNRPVRAVKLHEAPASAAPVRTIKTVEQEAAEAEKDILPSRPAYQAAFRPSEMEEEKRLAAPSGKAGETGEAAQAAKPAAAKRRQVIPLVPEPPVQAEKEPVSEEPEQEMDIDEFAKYACEYASSIDCSISGKSMLALYERIEIMEEDGEKLTKAAAEALIEEAADRAENPSLFKKMTGLFSSKYDKAGLLILKEEHFI
nr:hypothetical protein [uncultured Enterocloster sp.]